MYLAGEHSTALKPMTKLDLLTPCSYKQDQGELLICCQLSCRVLPQVPGLRNSLLANVV
jgi:hypothetical protein